MAEIRTPLKNDSRRHRVAQILRQEIIAGRLRPRDKLVEAELADQLGTSRGPVREALRQLEQEGLVMSYPYRGTEVLGVTDEEVNDILVPIRLTLEKFALTHGLKDLPDSVFDRLSSIVSLMEEAAARGSLDLLADLDVQFHQILIDSSGHEHSRQLWSVIQPRVWAYFRRDARRHTSAHDVVDQHARLLETLKSRDVDAAVAALTAHVHDLPGS
ncbi:MULTISPECIES: GntR family transcriptional regulator [unclassified Mycolicibacterium]|uniref:GntR family transcriptional regulator n=1 Tax=unclassified Mycolicibacterium TaxID=2636767 RepID=UPI002ED7ED74